MLEREPEKDFGTRGSAPGQFRFLYDVASLPVGRVCVADTYNDRLQIFSKDRSAEPRVIGEHGNQPGHSNARSAWRVTARRSTWPTPSTTACRSCASPTARTSAPWARRLAKVAAATQGQFNYPIGMCVAVDALFVCDSVNHGSAVTILLDSECG